MLKPLARMQQLAMSQVQRVQMDMLPDLHVGAGSLHEVPDVLKEHGVSSVMLLTTPGFVRRGTLSSLERDLAMRGFSVAVFSDVKPDPDIECVERAAAFYRSRNCDVMVAVGGGSVIDCAKVAGALVARPGKTARDLVGTMRVHAETPLLVAIPTTAGTGSETTAAAVVSDPESKCKYAIGDLALIPDVAILDPLLLVGLPRDLTAYTGMDALTHAVEAYINRFGSRAARRYAKQAVEIIFDHLKASFDDPDDVGHRENMLLASHYAGVAFTNALVGYVHALAHGIGGRYHVQHGLAIAVLLPVVLEEYGASAEHRLAQLGEAIGLDGPDDASLARAFIVRVRELADSMQIPRTIPEIREEDIPELAADAESEGNPAYPVPMVWSRAKFERVLHAVAGPADADASGMHQGGAADGAPDSNASWQTRITEPGPLLDETGRLAVRGWATSLVRDYNRNQIRTSKLRIKEWDYYLVNDADYALALTIGDLGYAALISASLVDFANKSFTTQSTIGVLPLGHLSLPATSSLGVTRFADKRVTMRFEVSGGLRRLQVDFNGFQDDRALHAEIVLDQEPCDSMVIATPWLEDELAFYYNQKIIGMRAIGSFSLGSLSHDFREDESFGLLDWGRGVWTRDNLWYWSAAQGVQNGRKFGFNLGYGFGDTRAATENMVFVDGVAHKLGRVDFRIPAGRAQVKAIGKRFALMEPWHMADDEGRLDFTFTPDIDRCDFMNLKLVVSDQHQVFGTFDGWVKLDDDSTFTVKGLRGFAEVVHNVY